MESGIVVARGWGKRGMGSYCLIGVSVWEYKNVLELDGGDGYTAI